MAGSSHPAEAARVRVPALDGLRACFAIAVVAHHTTGVHLGSYGVDGFFSLSGALIGGILLDTTGREGWAGRFYLRRTLRIWPLYFAVLAIASLTIPIHSPKIAWMPWVFLENYRALIAEPIEPIAFLVLWSVAVEEHAYLLLPALVRWMPRRRLPVALISICVGSTLLRVAEWWLSCAGIAAVGSWIYATQCRMDSIAVGVLAAWVLRDRPDLIPRMTRVSFYLWCVIAGIVLAAVNVWADPTNALQIALAPVTAYAVAFMFPALVTGRLPRLSRILGQPVLAYLGLISYGVYLIHPLIVAFVSERFFIALPVTVAVASASWYLCERPILSLSRASVRAERPAASVVAQPE